MPATCSAHESDWSTEELLTGIGSGDTLAWGELIRRYTGLVEGTVRGYRLQEADAADAVQNTWLRCAQHSRTLHFPERFAGWIRTVARRESLAQVRRRARDAALDIDRMVVADPGSGPEEQVITRDTRAGVRRAVALLPEPRRQLIDALFCDAPKSYAEIARQAQISIGSIGPTRARILTVLRDELHAHGPTAA